MTFLSTEQRKIIFDFDGVLTDFNQFIQKNAIGFFEKKYHMKVVNSAALEIEDIFDIQNRLECSGYSVQKAAEVKEQMLNHFWISHKFIKFSLLNRFRPGVREFINHLKNQGFIVEIHSSRSKTCEKNFVGMIARLFSIWQCQLNGIFLKKNRIFFYDNDKEKLKAILKSNAIIVFEDKPWIIEQLAEAGLNVLCVSGTHNKTVLPSKRVEVIDTFDKYGIENKMEKLLGKTSFLCHKREASSTKFFKKIIRTAFFFNLLFHPMILHPENIISEKKEGVIYAPNHRSTLDPIIVESVLKKHIHWVALARFFRGEDSIFNNNKNPVLCSITKYVFHKLEYFPIERKSDNPQANNITSLKDIDIFLKNGYKIGIFAEGTTRRAEGQDFGTFDDSFLRIARKNKSWIQPITLLWTQSSNIKSKVIVNFGKPFQVEGMSIKESMEYFMEIQKAGLRENSVVAERGD